MGTKVYSDALDLITFTRASGGTALRKISYGPELVTNGTFDSASDWDTSSHWVISGGTASHPSSSLFFALQQQLPVSAGKTYILSFDIISITDTLAVSMRNIGVSSTALASYATTGTKTVVFASVSGQDYLAFSRLSPTNLTAIIDNVSVKEVLFDQPTGTLTLFNHPNNIPRIEYAADGTLKGLLIEEQRTNLATYSEDFTNASWSKASISVTANATTAPDGTTTADKLVENFGTPAGNGAVKSFSITGNHAASIWVKSSGESRFLRLQLGASANWFNPDTGLWGTTEPGTSGHSVFGPVNGWYRVSLVYDGAAASDFFVVGMSNADGVASYTQNGTSGIYVWGAQLEAGAFPTSYIPTSGATATRSADIASIPVSDFGFNPDAGTLVVEARSLNTAGNAVIAALTDGTVDEQSRVQAGAGNQFVVVSGGVTQAALSGGSFPNGSFAFVSAAYKANDFAACLNGGSVATDTSGSVPSANKITLGINATSSGTLLNGHIKSIQYYPRKLTAAQLQELTS